MKRSRLLLVSAVLSTAVGLSPASLSAQDGTSAIEKTDTIEPMGSEEALVLDAKAYSAQFGVPLEEAMRRLVIMAGTSAEIEALEMEIGEDLSGVYFDNGPTFQLVVRTTGAQQRKARRLERKAERREGRRDARQTERRAERRAARRGIDISPAEIDLAASVIDQPAAAAITFTPNARQSRRVALRELQRNFDALKTAVPQLENAFYNEETGSIVVQAIGDVGSQTQTLTATLAATFKTPVVVEWVSSPMQDISLRGGDQLYYVDSSGRIAGPQC